MSERRQSEEGAIPREVMRQVILIVLLGAFVFVIVASFGILWTAPHRAKDVVEFIALVLAPTAGLLGFALGAYLTGE